MVCVVQNMNIGTHASVLDWSFYRLVLAYGGLAVACVSSFDLSPAVPRDKSYRHLMS